MRTAQDEDQENEDTEPQVTRTPLLKQRNKEEPKWSQRQGEGRGLRVARDRGMLGPTGKQEAGWGHLAQPGLIPGLTPSPKSHRPTTQVTPQGHGQQGLWQHTLSLSPQGQVAADITWGQVTARPGGHGPGESPVTSHC